jgi:Legume lectin domain/Chitobiase/beta-hexosaminidase C-terminal domain
MSSTSVTRINMSCPKASADGLYYPRFPNGDKFLGAGAAVSEIATGHLFSAAQFATTPTETTSATGILSSVGGGATLAFSYPSGFAGAASNLSLVGAEIDGSEIYVGNAPGHKSGGVWYTVQQPTASFRTNFTFQITGQTVGTAEIAGMTFCVQNSMTPPGSGFTGLDAVNDANLAGYGSFNKSGQFPLSNSVGVLFDCNWNNQVTYQSGGNPSSSGLYVYGGPYGGFVPCNDLTPYGINFYNGNVFKVDIVYDGTLLTMVVQDMTTGAQARCVWPIDIPACTANTTSYVGFTAGKVASILQYVQTWSFWTGYNTRLSTPTFSPAPGEYSSAQTVTISGPSGASIYYTTNGLLPTSSSTLYTGPITVSANTVIQAVAIWPTANIYTDSLVALAQFQIGTSNAINFPIGFSSGDGAVLVGYASLSGSAIQLTDTASQPAGEVGNAWFAAPVNIQAFTTTFTFSINGNGQGMTFIIQAATSPAANTPSWASVGGPTVIGGNQNALGYGGVIGLGAGSNGLQNSIAIKFDVNSGNTTGIYANDAEPGVGGTTITGVTLDSGHTLTCGLVYDGTTLTMTLTDPQTEGEFSTSFTVNIPSIVGGNTAYVGFGGSNGGATAVQKIHSWTGFSA